MDVVFHVAGITGIWGRVQDFWSINVEGTRNVLAACRSGGVPRLVFTSSPSVVSGTAALCGVDEAHPYPARFIGAYSATKATAERLALAANGPALATVAIRPHLIFGPGDLNLIPRIVARAKAGKLRQVGNGGNLVDVTYIDNAAEAHLLAGRSLAPESPCAGRPYFISQGAPVTLWPWLNDILLRLGAPMVCKTIGYRKAYAIGAAMEAAYRLLRVEREPIMTRFLAVQLGKDHFFDISAARRDLGYTPRVSTEEAVRRTVEAWEPPSALPAARVA
jgi:nucleoside-diphosphate-sugar epimerase